MFDTISPRRGIQPPISHRETPSRNGRFFVRGSASLGKTANIPTSRLQQGASVSDRTEERFALKAIAERLLPQERVAKCLNFRNRDAKVSGIQTPHGWKFGGLQTCGSVWHCPVCAAKISERRRLEVCNAVARHGAAGGQTYLLTLTIAHYDGQSLALLRDKLRKAQGHFSEGRAWSQLRADIGYVGKITNTEVTHGRRRELSNGWHPHIHVLIFAARSLDVLAIEQRMYAMWAKACSRAGLPPPSRLAGARFQGGDAAAGYLTKWSMELAKSHTKHGKLGGETPFDLLRAIAADSADIQAAALFREYALAMRGKMQLVWSPGLKKRYAVDERTDEQLADGADEQEMDRIDIDRYWFDIRQKGARALVLRILNENGPDALRAWLRQFDTDSDLLE